MKTYLFLVLAFALLVGCISYQQQANGQQAQQELTQEVKEEAPVQEQQPDQTQEEQLSGEIVDGVREVVVTAKQFEFIPNPIIVKKGERVRLRITSTDVTHGLAIPEYDINVQLPPGEEVVVEFTADKEGEFDLFCSVYCGLGHGSMRAKLIVVE